MRAAQALGLGLRLHADQFSADYGSLLAAELGAATADHLESTTPPPWTRCMRPACNPSCFPLRSTTWARRATPPRAA